MACSFGHDDLTHCMQEAQQEATRSYGEMEPCELTDENLGFILSWLTLSSFCSCSTVARRWHESSALGFATCSGDVKAATVKSGYQSSWEMVSCPSCRMVAC